MAGFQVATEVLGVAAEAYAIRSPDWPVPSSFRLYSWKGTPASDSRQLQLFAKQSIIPLERQLTDGRFDPPENTKPWDGLKKISR